MTKHHVIIGGGPAATNAVETIRQLEDAPARISLVCDEPAHSRMALPYWLAGDIPREQTYTGNEAYFRKLAVDAYLGVRAQLLDAPARTVVLDDGRRLEFDQLLIAAGSSPVAPDLPGAQLPGVQPLWSLADTDRLLNAARDMQQPRVVLIGAGFIGFIVLNAMFKRGWRLSVVEREPQLLPRMLDRGAADMVAQWLNDRRVEVRCSAVVKQIRSDQQGAKQVCLADGQTLPADLVILATGIRPNVELARTGGIAIEEGILVDERMQTNVPGVYAGGDVAQGPVLFGGRPAIHAIQPTAVDHGRVAGANMAGRDVRYAGSLLMNIVDVCGLQCASFGHWSDPSAEAMTIANSRDRIYRKLLWTGDQITGAIFVGRPHDLGMLTDVGMLKGMLQTRTCFGPWKDYLQKNPFDLRRAYVAAGVPQRLVGSTLLGQATRPRQYRFGDAQPTTPVGPAHSLFVNTKTP